MRKVSPKYIQLFSDAVIPLAGILFWNWSLYFILLFYILDMMASEVIIHFKSKKAIEYYGKGQKTRLSFGIQSALLLLISYATIHAAMYFVQPGISFKEEIYAFWTYEELGIQQGYVLAPFVAFGAYYQYKITFLMSAKYRTIAHVDIWKSHIKALLAIIASAGIVIGLAQIIEIPELVYVLLIVGGSTCYQLFINRD